MIHPNILKTYKGLTIEKLKIFKKFYDKYEILTNSKDDLMDEEKQHLQ